MMPDLQPYLAETSIINFRHPAITAVAADLMQTYPDDIAPECVKRNETEKIIV